MSSICIFGVFVADLCFFGNKIPERGETVLGNNHLVGPGVKGSNQAIAAARLDGVNIDNAARAILSVFPLDSFIVSKGGTAANRMQVDDKPNELTDTHKEFIKAVKDVSGNNWEVGSIERQSFYEEAKKSYAIVTTTDARPFGCFIITKGVIKPDGSVWVLDK